MTHHETDLVIIGAGPVGLFAIFEAGMLKMKCHVIDTLDAVGGQCAALYPEKPIYDIPAYPKIGAQELIDKLKEQAAPFEPVYHLGQQVVSVSPITHSPLAGESENAQRDRVGGKPSGDTSTSPPTKSSDEDLTPPQGGSVGGYTVTTSAGTTIACKAVIIAAGAGAFGPNRPPLEGIEAYEGTSVHYMVTRKESLRGKRVAIAGGGDSAVDWALLLADIAEHVYFIHRRPKFRAAPDSVQKLNRLAEEGKVEMVIPFQLDGLEGEGGQLEAVKVKTLKGEEKTLDAQVLLPFFGLAMELGPIADWGLNLHMNHIEVTPASCETNHPGIYAIGDIATYEGKLKLILCGFSEAAMACHSAYNHVYPDKALHFEYSTSKGVG
jgi:thioredoxin reductase (NADPH)